MELNLGISILLLLLVVLPIAIYLYGKMWTYGRLRAQWKFKEEQKHNHQCNGKGDSFYE